jgi:hypothetical protein
MSIRREEIEVQEAVQSDEEVLLVRSAWNKDTWDSVRQDISNRIAAGQTPVTLSHLEQLGLTEVVRLLAIDPETP